MVSTRASINGLCTVALAALVTLSTGCHFTIYEKENSGNKTVVSTPLPVEQPAPVPASSLPASPSPQTPSATPSLNGDYPMSMISNTCPELRIRKVTVTDSKTTIELNFTHSELSADTKIRTAAPGQQTAFYIVDPDSGKEYKLLNVEGIAMEPSWTPIRSGESLDFTLTFERIPDSVTKFHLIEGKVQSFSEEDKPLNSWTFMNVTLK